MSKKYELNLHQTFRYLISDSTAQLRATYEWVPSIAEDFSQQGGTIESANRPVPRGPGWRVTLDFGVLPFIDVPEDASYEQLNYEEALVALCPTLCGAKDCVEGVFKKSWVPNRSHEIDGSEEAFQYALSIELSEGAAVLHERIALEPQLLQNRFGDA
jgi:hypothetical protein